MSLKGIAKATLSILEQGHYTSPGGSTRPVASELTYAKKHTQLYRPTDFPLSAAHKEASGTAPDIEVREGTTQAVAQELVQAEHIEDLVLLCFASARNVCGGFLKGARSQEEDLALIGTLCMSAYSA